MAKANRSPSQLNRETVTLAGDQARALSSELDDVVHMLRAMHDLALSGCNLANSDTASTSIENMAKLAIRKTDRVAVALGSVPQGNFEEEFRNYGPQRNGQ